jgi:hypothetical protein
MPIVKRIETFEIRCHHFSELSIQELDRLYHEPGTQLDFDYDEQLIYVITTTTEFLPLPVSKNL